MNPFNILRKFIQHRRFGGAIYVNKKIAKEFYNLHKSDEFGNLFKEIYWYLVKVYWLTGEITKRIGIDKRHWKKLNELFQNISNTPVLNINDINVHIDCLFTLNLVCAEYQDIFPSGMYYDKNGKWMSEPDFTETVFLGEGPYETKSVQIYEDDIVVDCGANMGLFSLLAVKRGAKTVYGFDPQERALSLLNTNISTNKCEGKIIPVPFGLSDRKCTLSFTENEENIGASRISREGDVSTTSIECTTLDDWVAENNIPRVDFIKADIEGAERDMLNGARNTIKRNHPRLAICTYHLPDDPEVLQEIILSIDPTYHVEQREKKLYAW